MARRRRSSIGRFKPVNIRFVIFQIIVLIAFLIALFAVQDSISEGTSEVLTSLTGEDVEVQQPVDDSEEGQFPGQKTDDGAKNEPADDDSDHTREADPADVEETDDRNGDVDSEPRELEGDNADDNR